MPPSTSLVKYLSESGAEVELSPDIIRKYLSPSSRPTDEEIFMFLRLCEAQRLNPFLREAYLIKYGNNPATLVVGWQVFLARAAKNPDFNGYTCDVRDSEGNLYVGLPDQEIQYAEAKVYRKSWEHPVVVRALFKEYSTGRSNWAPDKIPATMIAKVAISQALRQAFPVELGGLYAQEEMRAAQTQDTDSSPFNMPPITQQHVSLAPQPASVSYAVVEDGEIVEQKARISPFAAVKYLSDVYGAKWAKATGPNGDPVVVTLFGEVLNTPDDMRKLFEVEPDRWDTGADALLQVWKEHQAKKK